MHITEIIRHVEISLAANMLRSCLCFLSIRPKPDSLQTDLQIHATSILDVVDVSEYLAANLAFVLSLLPKFLFFGLNLIDCKQTCKFMQPPF